MTNEVYYQGPTKSFTKEQFIARVSEKAAAANLSGSEKQITWARKIQMEMIQDAIEKIDAIPDGKACGGFFADEYKVGMIALFSKVGTRDLIDSQVGCASVLFTVIRKMMYKMPNDFSPKPLA